MGTNKVLSAIYWASSRCADLVVQASAWTSAETRKTSNRIVIVVMWDWRGRRGWRWSIGTFIFIAFASYRHRTYFMRFVWCAVMHAVTAAMLLFHQFLRNEIIFELVRKHFLFHFIRSLHSPSVFDDVFADDFNSSNVVAEHNVAVHS